jgi:hypothetical protein
MSHAPFEPVENYPCASRLLLFFYEITLLPLMTSNNYLIIKCKRKKNPSIKGEGFYISREMM